MEPELMRDVLLKSNIIQKTPSHPLVKLLVSDIVAQEGEQWAKHRKIINPVFKQEYFTLVSRKIINPALHLENFLVFFFNYF